MCLRHVCGAYGGVCAYGVLVWGAWVCGAFGGVCVCGMYVVPLASMWCLRQVEVYGACGGVGEKKRPLRCGKGFFLCGVWFAAVVIEGDGLPPL